MQQSFKRDAGRQRIPMALTREVLVGSSRGDPNLKKVAPGYPLDDLDQSPEGI